MSLIWCVFLNDLQIQETWQTSSSKNIKETMPMIIIETLLKTKQKQKSLKQPDLRSITYRGQQ